MSWALGHMDGCPGKWPGQVTKEAAPLSLLQAFPSPRDFLSPYSWDLPHHSQGGVLMEREEEEPRESPASTDWHGTQK